MIVSKRNIARAEKVSEILNLGDDILEEDLQHIEQQKARVRQMPRCLLQLGSSSSAGRTLLSNQAKVVSSSFNARQQMTTGGFGGRR